MAKYGNGLTRKKRVRLTEEQDELLMRKAREAGMDDNISAYIRYLITNSPADRPEISHELRKLRYELSKIGTNINQITKSYNSAFYDYRDKARLMEYMEEVSGEMARIRKLLEEVR